MVEEDKAGLLELLLVFINLFSLILICSILNRTLFIDFWFNMTSNYSIMVLYSIRILISIIFSIPVTFLSFKLSHFTLSKLNIKYEMNNNG